MNITDDSPQKQDNGLPIRQGMMVTLFLLCLFLSFPTALIKAQGQHLSLYNVTYNGPKTFTTTQSISVGPDVLIDNGGIITLGAPSVFLLEEVYVKNGGSLFIVSGSIATQNEALLNPFSLTVFQNYPNPLSSSTKIEYQLGLPGQVEILVYDLFGREINQLFSGFQTPGIHAVEWDGTNMQGMPVASGLYFYRFVTGQYSTSKQMSVIR